MNIKLDEILKKNKAFITLFLTIIFMAIFYPPKLVEDISIYRYVRLLQTGLFLVSIIILILFRKTDKFIIITGIYFCIFLVSTFLYGKNMELYIAHMTSTFAPLVLFFYLYNIDKFSFMKGIKYYSFYILFLHTILLLLYRDGVIISEVNQNITKGIHVFGESNQSTIIVVMSYFIILVEKYFSKSKDKIWILLATILSILSIFLIESSNGKLGMVFILFGLTFLVALNILEIDILKNGRNKIVVLIVLSFIIINILMTVVRIQELFNPLINLIFKKDATLSSRTLIWDEALRLIRKKPLLGYGSIFGRFVYISEYDHYYDTHNLFLETTLRGGVLLILTYISLAYLSVKEILKNYSKEIKYISLIFVSALFIMSISEVYKLNIIFFILYLPYLINKKNEVE